MCDGLKNGTPSVAPDGRHRDARIASANARLMQKA
jgi:hypothetical protein